MLTLYNAKRRSLKQWAERMEECQRRLTEQRIEPGNPGTILNDIQTMLEFVGPQGLLTQSRNAALPTDRLPELNARISHPLELRLKRALLRDYPNLAGLFILLRVMNLYQAEEKRLRVNPSTLAVWRDLNPTEQYFALLEALLFLAQSSALAEERRSREDAEAFDTLTMFLSQLTERWHTFERYESIYTFGSHGDIRPWKLFLLQQLGLVELRPVPESHESRRQLSVSGWLIGAARLTPWGTAVTWGLLAFASPETAGPGKSPRSMAWSLFSMLAQTTNGGQAAAEPSPSEPELGFDVKEPPPGEGQAEPPTVPAQAAGAGESEDEAGDAEEMPEEVFDETNEEAGFGTLQPVFQPYFPEWQKVYGPPKGEARTGTHVFKVSITGLHGDGRVWRRLAVPPDASLDDLACAILDAYGFDDDHLWDFSFRDQRGKNRQYNRPEGDEGPYTDEISVAATELPLKGEMIFTFDYGDNWQFKVVLENVEPGRSSLKRPQIVASAGKSPQQYPDWDE